MQLWLDETSMPKAKTEPAEVMVEADMGSLFRLWFRRVSWNGKMLLSELPPN